jgi:hypothetical protein
MRRDDAADQLPPFVHGSLNLEESRFLHFQTRAKPLKTEVVSVLRVYHLKDLSKRQTGDPLSAGIQVHQTGSHQAGRA